MIHLFPSYEVWEVYGLFAALLTVNLCSRDALTCAARYELLAATLEVPT